MIAILTLYKTNIGDLPSAEMISIAIGGILFLTYVMYIIFGVTPFRIF